MAKVSKNRSKEMLRVKLAEIFLKESSNPDFEGVTITSVEASPDMEDAKVLFCMYINDEETIKRTTKKLNAASGFFRTKLSRTLKSRKTPKLNFVYDKGFEHSSRIDEVLYEVRDDVAKATEREEKGEE